MVVIRKLQPVVQIALPSRPQQIRPRSYVHVERRRVNFPPPTPQPTPCVLWQGSVDRDGYGRMKRGPEGFRETVRVIRWVMSEALGRPLLTDEHVLHACDNPPCFRVDHLSVGSIQDNNRDMFLKGRARKPPVNVYQGEAHPMAKLTATKVAEIRGHWISGLAVKTIADMYGVSPSTVRKIVKGLLWGKGTAQLGLPPSAARREVAAERTKPVKRKLKIPTEVRSASADAERTSNVKSKQEGPS